MNNKQVGVLYGVSLGPGDPDLITRHAWSLLQRSDAVWTYPVRSKKSDSYALDIVLRAGLSLPTAHQALVFPMTHDQEKLAKYWLQAAEIILARLLTGQDVLFLVEGDASTYSTFGHLARTLLSLDQSIQVETLAGVCSFNAAAARLQTSLADTDDTIAIIPASYGVTVIDELLKQFDTLVLLKVKPLMDEIIDLLSQRNLIEHSQFIEKAGTPDEHIVKDISTLKGSAVNYLSLLLVKNPHRERGKPARGCRSKSGAEKRGMSV